MYKHLYFLIFFYSLTEGTSKGSHLAIKEGTTQKHTQSVKQHCGQPAADRERLFSKHLKHKGFEHLQWEINIANNLQG